MRSLEIKKEVIMLIRCCILENDGLLKLELRDQIIKSNKYCNELTLENSYLLCWMPNI